MANLVYFASGLRGSLYNTTELSRRLIERGHTVAIASFRDVAADVTAVGASFHHLTDGPNAVQELEERVAKVGRLRALPFARTLRQRVIESTEVEDLVAKLSPDLILVDGEMHGAIIATGGLATPRIAVLPFYSVHPSTRVPPANTTLPPGTSLRGRAACTTAWLALWARRWLDRTVGVGPKTLRARLVPFQLNSPNITNIRAVAKHHDFDLKRTVRWRQWLHPHIYDLPILSYTSASLDFARTVPPDFHYIGPMINHRRIEPLISDVDMERCEQFLTSATAADRPVIYASMGSMQHASRQYYETTVSYTHLTLPTICSV